MRSIIENTDPDMLDALVPKYAFRFWYRVRSWIGFCWVVVIYYFFLVFFFSFHIWFFSTQFHSIVFSHAVYYFYLFTSITFHPYKAIFIVFHSISRCTDCMICLLIWLNLHNSTPLLNTPPFYPHFSSYSHNISPQFINLSFSSYSTSNWTWYVLIWSRLLGKFPNTYSFTKSLSEQLVYDYRNEFPTAIARPPISEFI